MPTPTQPSDASLSSLDAQHVEDTLSRIAPKWTTWSTQTLAHHGPLRTRELAAHLPFVHETALSRRLGQMHADGLVTRAGDSQRSPYQLSALGAALSPVHRALSDWSQHHLSLGTVADAERVEDALRRLHLRHSTAVIQVLGTGGPTRFVHIAEEVGLYPGLARHRINRLQLDGLVTRVGPRHGDPYALTDAGQALGPVYTAVECWSNLTTERLSTPPASARSAAQSHSRVPLGAGDVRTAAALRRSTVVPSAVFSHPPQPQPRVPAAVIHQSAPSPCRLLACRQEPAAHLSLPPRPRPAE
ncbi:winged helix-turn-helix transcriptional regulator [Streptomyces buecherae]|uniref:winged helix-turn-helix transcriptional regulator n=1 Tax=Streptomyces buecherae TaxID=2763006 RepID=UPI003692A9DA